MLFLTADKIFPISSAPLSGHVLIIDQGIVKDLVPEKDVPAENVQHLSGYLVPGFINSHCHLELSFMKGKIAEKIGLDNFIKEVELLKKESSIEERLQAIESADRQMAENGIVAVGDISNTNETFESKERSSLYYHTFIELYAFDPAKANQVFEKGEKFKAALRTASSLTPHAPYSISHSLLQRIISEEPSLISIHNQESPEENELFTSGKGKIFERLKYFGIPTAHFQPTGKSSLESLLGFYSQVKKVQLVHNTFTSSIDLQLIKNQSKTDFFLCFCPKANLYIEDTLPDIKSIYNYGNKITIGTDSLASNDCLNILSEVKSISDLHKDIPLHELFKWSTFNGAELLGIDDRFGSFEKGKRPGVSLISKDLTEVTPLV